MAKKTNNTRPESESANQAENKSKKAAQKSYVQALLIQAPLRDSVCDLLIQAGADPKLVKGETIPMVHAIQSADHEALVRVIKDGAQPNARYQIDRGANGLSGTDEVTPLMIALLRKKPAAVESLLSLGADPTDIQWVPDFDTWRYPSSSKSVLSYAADFDPNAIKPLCDYFRKQKELAEKDKKASVYTEQWIREELVNALSFCVFHLKSASYSGVGYAACCRLLEEGVDPWEPLPMTEYQRLKRLSNIKSQLNEGQRGAPNNNTPLTESQKKELERERDELKASTFQKQSFVQCLMEGCESNHALLLDVWLESKERKNLTQFLTQTNEQGVSRVEQIFKSIIQLGLTIQEKKPMTGSMSVGYSQDQEQMNQCLDVVAQKDRQLAQDVAMRLVELALPESAKRNNILMFAPFIVNLTKSKWVTDELKKTLKELMVPYLGEKLKIRMPVDLSPSQAGALGALVEKAMMDIQIKQAANQKSKRIKKI